MICQRLLSAVSTLLRWKAGDEPYYPVNDEKNGQLYAKYKELADKENGVIFGGRLGEYKYYDMDTTIASVLDMCGEGAWLIVRLPTKALFMSYSKRHGNLPWRFYLQFFPARFISAAGICSLRHSYPYSFEYAYIAGSCLDKRVPVLLSQSTRHSAQTQEHHQVQAS